MGCLTGVSRCGRAVSVTGMRADSMTSRVSSCMGRSNMTNVTCVSMTTMAEVAEHDGDKHEKQAEQKTAYEKQGKRISCHSFAPSAAKQLSDNNHRLVLS
jgi:hypothetical protein